MGWPVFLLVMSVALSSAGGIGYLVTSKLQNQNSAVPEYVRSKGDYVVGNGSYRKGEVQDLDISWVGGNLKILVSDSDELLVKENLHGKKVDDNQKVHWKVQDGKLTLTPAKPGERPYNLERDLVIHVPKELKSVALNTVATDVIYEDISSSKVDFNVTASDVDISLLNAAELNIRGTSANVKIHLLDGLGANVSSNGVAIDGKFDDKHGRKCSNTMCKININGVSLHYEIV